MKSDREFTIIKVNSGSPNENKGIKVAYALGLKRLRRNKMKNRKVILMVLAILLVAGLIAGYLVYNQNGFTGSRTKNPDAYILEMERMQGKDQHQLDLKAGDDLMVQMAIEKGQFAMEIKDPDGQVIYSGNEKSPAENFSMNITKEGTYIIEVDADHARGKVSVKING